MQDKKLLLEHPTPPTSSTPIHPSISEHISAKQLLPASAIEHTEYRPVPDRPAVLFPANFLAAGTLTCFPASHGTRPVSPYLQRRAESEAIVETGPITANRGVLQKDSKFHL